MWDTCGQESFRGIIRSYYRGADAFIIYYNITDRTSFTHVKSWLSEVEMHRKDSNYAYPKLLIGCKSDLQDHRTTTYEEAKTFAINNNMLYIETSSKTGENVEAAYNTFAKMIISDPAYINARQQQIEARKLETVLARRREEYNKKRKNCHIM